MKTTIIVLVCSLSAATLAQNSISDLSITVLQPGIYRSVTTDKVADPNTATGSQSLTKDTKLVKETTQIPAVIGVEFGFRFRLEGAEKGQKVAIERVDIFPIDGLHPPGENSPRNHESFTTKATVGGTSYIGYELEHEWEAVPGDWVLQAWYGGKKLAEVKFTLMKSDK